MNCPGCGLTSDVQSNTLNPQYNASEGCLSAYNTLTIYTLSLSDADFIHQLAVDAYASQHVGEQSKNMGIAFGLIGLCLRFERDFTGRQVQQAHRLLAEQTKTYPRFEAPGVIDAMIVTDVLTAPAGGARNAALNNWGRSVWEAWGDQHDGVRDLIDKYRVR